MSEFINTNFNNLRVRLKNITESFYKKSIWKFILINKYKLKYNDEKLTSGKLTNLNQEIKTENNEAVDILSSAKGKLINII